MVRPQCSKTCPAAKEMQKLSFRALPLCRQRAMNSWMPIFVSLHLKEFVLEWNSDNDIAFKRQQKIDEMRKNVTKLVWNRNTHRNMGQEYMTRPNQSEWLGLKPGNLESWVLEFGIQLKEFGIPLRLESVIQVPLTNNPESSMCTWVRNQRCRIQNLRLLGFPYIRGTQREYSSKPLKHSSVKRILVF